VLQRAVLLCEAREQEAAANLAIEEEFEAALADAAKGPGPSLAELIAEYKNASVERRSAFVRSRRKAKKVRHHKAALQRLAEQRLAEQHLAEQRLAEQRLAEQRLADQRLASERRAAEHLAAPRQASQLLAAKNARRKEVQNEAAVKRCAAKRAWHQEQRKLVADPCVAPVKKRDRRKGNRVAASPIANTDAAKCTPTAVVDQRALQEVAPVMPMLFIGTALFIASAMLSVVLFGGANALSFQSFSQSQAPMPIFSQSCGWTNIDSALYSDPEGGFALPCGFE